MKVIACDIDHTLSDATWRDEFIGGDRYDCATLSQFSEEHWDKYHGIADRDYPNEEVRDLISFYASSGYHVILFTARSEKYKKKTTDWLSRHSVGYDNLLMRPIGNRKGSAQLKHQLLEDFLIRCKLTFGDVKLVIDDHPDVISWFNSLGVSTMHYKKGTM